MDSAAADMDVTRQRSLPVRLEPPENRPIEVAPFSRAPTLLGGESAGSQGLVQVWSPTMRRLYLSLVVATLVGALGLWIWFDGHQLNTWLLIYAGVTLYSTIRGLWRPAYVTTDGAGIGITTWRSSRALRWNEIRAALYQPPNLYCGPYIELKIPTRVAIYVSGYSREEQKALYNLIVERASLSGNKQEPGSTLPWAKRPLRDPEGYPLAVPAGPYDEWLDANHSDKDLQALVRILRRGMSDRDAKDIAQDYLERRETGCPALPPGGGESQQ